MLATLLAAAAAIACAVAPPATSPLVSDERPPERFRGDARVTMEFVPAERLAALCSMCPPPGYQVNGCTTRGVIYLENPCHYRDADRFAHLACHELGHVNGWPAVHGP